MPEEKRWPWQDTMELTISISPDVKALWKRTLDYLESASSKAVQKKVDELTGRLSESNAGLEDAVDASKES